MKCADVIRDVRRLFYLQSEKDRQIIWYNEYYKVDHQIETLFQREIYLLEEISFLENKRQGYIDGKDDKDDETLIDAKFDIARETPEEKQELSSEDNSKLDAMKKEVPGIREHLFLLKARRGGLEFRRPGGPWMADFYDFRLNKWWDRMQATCKERGGCCSRGCGCCREPRQPSTGQKSSANGTTYHCTVACGCCVRERRFYIPSSERLKEATNNWIRDWELDWLIEGVT